jgi:hypothetical protein
MDLGAKVSGVLLLPPGVRNDHGEDVVLDLAPSTNFTDGNIKPSW